jgi:hypothetical protein
VRPRAGAATADAAVGDRPCGRISRWCVAKLSATSLQPEVVSLGYTCALLAEDFEQAEARLAATTPATLEPAAVSLHAIVRSEQGDPTGALALLEQVEAGDPKVRKSLQVKFLGEAGRAKEALPLLSDPDVDPNEGWRLATGLITNNEYLLAYQALTIVCPRVDPEPQDVPEGPEGRPQEPVTEEEASGALH